MELAQLKSALEANDAVICIDKPLYWTSFTLVGRVRWAVSRYLGVKKAKVGHAGTLDPLATGVMIVCVGKATKQIEAIQAGSKEYEATLCLGAVTPSFDMEHPVSETFPVEHITEDAVRSVIYNRGKQQGTVFNRNLVAQISRMMVMDGIIKETNDVMMAELLEPEKGKHHPVRNQLGLVPDDSKVKKAVEEVFKRYGVKVP